MAKGAFLVRKTEMPTKRTTYKKQKSEFTMPIDTAGVMGVQCSPRATLAGRQGHWRRVGLFAACLLVSQLSFALNALDDEEMAQESGAGIAVSLVDFGMRMAPTSYIELTGTAPNAAAAAYGWKRGDLRYYGLSMTGMTGNTDWYGNGCTPGASGLCPIGTSGAKNFASVYNPYLLRVFQYPGYDYLGNNLTTATAPTVLELVGPSKADDWRLGFWGALDVGRGTSWATGTTAGNCLNGTGTTNTGYCGLQSQTIIKGKPITADGKPSIMRIMRINTANDPSGTFGFTYQSALSGDFRFSVNQASDTNAVAGQLYTVPDFTDTEGLYFKNVDAFLPMGRLNSQALTLAATPAKDGNFAIELTRIPTAAAAYNDIYCGAATCSLDASNAIASPNAMTHGYVRWGTTSNSISSTATNDGIYFSSPAGSVVNLGNSRIEGMLIQHMKITTLGAGP